MICFPNAKINLGLNIVNRRSDGYHDIETIFYPIKIHDALEAIESDKTRVRLSGIFVPGSPQENLCLKAYNLIGADYELPAIHIHLHKNIPIGAGLGGGSADAAFFIALLNDKFQLGMEISQMEVYARQLGADCAFFLHNKPMYAFGKGDEFESLTLDLSPYHIVLVMPPVHVSTAEAYAGVRPMPSSSSLKVLLQTPVTNWLGNIKNDFEESVFKIYPEIEEVKKELYHKGAFYASMSGSGAAVYGIFANKPDLRGVDEKNKVFYGV